MPSPEIEEFGKLVVEHVRDMAIRACDMNLRPGTRNPAARRWRESGARAEALRGLIPDVVDQTIFYLMHALDNGLLRAKFIASSGKEIDLAEDGLGELAGWYAGSDEGWRGKFSDERFTDFTADIADPE